MMLQTKRILAGAGRVLEIELRADIECKKQVALSVVIFDGARIFAGLHSKSFG
jgi:hypothetical protein